MLTIFAKQQQQHPGKHPLAKNILTFSQKLKFRFCGVSSLFSKVLSKMVKYTFVL